MFVSDSAQSTFGSLLRIPAAILNAEASPPGLLRMTLHLLQLLDKVCVVLCMYQELPRECALV